jgi:hypothetical protein
MDVVHEFNEDNRIWGLLESIPPERHDEIAELCAEFCRAHSVFVEFISHTVQHEVHNTSKYFLKATSFSDYNLQYNL